MSDRRRGLAAGTGAGLLWGLAFVVPELLGRVSAIDLTLGRYLAYGAVSALLLRARLDPAAWRSALAFAVTGHAGYYLLLVLAVEGAGAPLTAVIVGAIPVTVAVAGARREGRGIAHLRLPLALIAAGLALVNGAAMAGAGTTAGDALVPGIAAAAGATAVWTWYGVANAAFVVARPDIGPGTWSSAVGTATLALAVAAAGVRAVAGGAAPAPLGAFVAGSLVLGLAVSWLAGLLWNRASADLPVEQAGQLIVVETLAGATYGFLAAAALPDPVTLGGLALLTAGVLSAVRGRAGGAVPAPADDRVAR